MKRYMTWFTVLAVAMMTVSFLNAQETKVKKKLTKAERQERVAKQKEKVAKILEEECKCPISGRPVDAEKFVEYKDSKVYMCCGNCVKGFEAKLKEDETLAAKANHQLYLTMQARQAKCAINPKAKVKMKKTAVEFDGTKVGFCCENCQGKFKEMDDAAKLELAFGKNFDEAFVVKAVQRKKNKEKQAKEKAEKRKAEKEKAA